MMIVGIVTTVLFSYLLGSLPYGLILVKLLKGKDLREIGSKNIGTTNVLRAGYPILAVLTLFLDAFKGLIAVVIFAYIFSFDGNTAFWASLAGLSAVLGHIYPIWLGFKGGKGVATIFGTIFALNPILGLITITTWLLIALIFHYSSLAAIITMALLPFYALLISPIYFFVCAFVSILILYKHKENIVRLYNKTETKIKFKHK